MHTHTPIGRDIGPAPCDTNCNHSAHPDSLPHEHADVVIGILSPSSVISDTIGSIPKHTDSAARNKLRTISSKRSPVTSNNPVWDKCGGSQFWGNTLDYPMPDYPSPTDDVASSPSSHNRSRQFIGSDNWSHSPMSVLRVEISHRNGVPSEGTSNVHRARHGSHRDLIPATKTNRYQPIASHGTNSTQSLSAATSTHS